MKIDKRSDIFLNVVCPLLLGLLIYWLTKFVSIPTFIRNYLPDGLWAYAFMSCILLIWEREFNIAWIAFAFLFSISFEVAQHYHLISGTGDIEDVFTYFLSFIIALTLNRFFKALTFTSNP